jgi:hypothetical protein
MVFRDVSKTFTAVGRNVHVYCTREYTEAKGRQGAIDLYISATKLFQERAEAATHDNK